MSNELITLSSDDEDLELRLVKGPPPVKAPLTDSVIDLTKDIGNSKKAGQWLSKSRASVVPKEILKRRAEDSFMPTIMGCYSMQDKAQSGDIENSTWKNPFAPAPAKITKSSSSVSQKHLPVISKVENHKNGLPKVVQCAETNALNADEATTDNKNSQICLIANTFSVVKTVEEDKLEPGEVIQPKPLTLESELEAGEVQLDDLEPGEVALDLFNEDNPDKLYKEFIDVFSLHETSKIDLDKALKKLNKYYNQCDKLYTSSAKFAKLLNQLIKDINERKLMVYIALKEVLDNLKSREQAKSGKKRVKLTTVENESAQVGSCNGDTACLEDQHGIIEEPLDPRKRKVVRRLSKTLRKLEKKIQMLENEEVDLNDETGSTYLQMQKYRERFVKVHKKLCQYMGQTSNAGRVLTQHISISCTNYPVIDRAIEKWLNKSKRFPDYTEIVKVVSERSSQLGINPLDVDVLAREVFSKVGTLLKRRRKFDLWDSLSCYLGSTRDPADDDPVLRSTLDESLRHYKQKEQQIFNEYAEKQAKEKAVAMEVADEEADLSPQESGDEDEAEIAAAEASDVEETVGIDENRTLVKETKNNFKNCKSRWKKDTIMECSVNLTKVDETTLAAEKDLAVCQLSAMAQDAIDKVDKQTEDGDVEILEDAKEKASTAGQPTAIEKEFFFHRKRKSRREDDCEVIEVGLKSCWSPPVFHVNQCLVTYPTLSSLTHKKRTKLDYTCNEHYLPPALPRALPFVTDKLRTKLDYNCNEHFLPPAMPRAKRKKKRKLTSKENIDPARIKGNKIRCLNKCIISAAKECAAGNNTTGTRVEDADAAQSDDHAENQEEENSGELSPSGAAGNGSSGDGGNGDEDREGKHNNEVGDNSEEQTEEDEEEEKRGDETDRDNRVGEQPDLDNYSNELIENQQHQQTLNTEEILENHQNEERERLHAEERREEDNERHANEEEEGEEVRLNVSNYGSEATTESDEQENEEPNYEERNSEDEVEMGWIAHKSDRSEEEEHEEFEVEESEVMQESDCLEEHGDNEEFEGNCEDGRNVEPRELESYDEGDETAEMNDEVSETFEMNEDDETGEVNEDDQTAEMNDEEYEATEMNDEENKAAGIIDEENETLEMDEEDQTAEINEDDQTAEMNDEENEATEINDEENETLEMNEEDQTAEINDEENETTEMNDEENETLEMNEDQTAEMNGEKNETAEINEEDDATGLNDKEETVGLNDEGDSATRNEDMKKGVELNEENDKTEARNEDKELGIQQKEKSDETEARNEDSKKGVKSNEKAVKAAVENEVKERIDASESEDGRQTDVKKETVEEGDNEDSKSTTLRKKVDIEIEATPAKDEEATEVGVRIKTELGNPDDASTSEEASVKIIIKKDQDTCEAGPSDVKPLIEYTVLVKNEVENGEESAENEVENGREPAEVTPEVNNVLIKEEVNLPEVTNLNQTDMTNQTKVTKLNQTKVTKLNQTEVTTVSQPESEASHVDAQRQLRKRRAVLPAAPDVEVISEKKRAIITNPVVKEMQVDDRVKKLLQNNTSISITKLPKSAGQAKAKPISEAALQALATLKKLKSISTTRVQRSSNEDDVVVIGQKSVRGGGPQQQRPTPQRCTPQRGSMQGGASTSMPIIASVQSINRNTPKILKVQGNAVGFGPGQFTPRPSVRFPSSMRGRQPAMNLPRKGLTPDNTRTPRPNIQQRRTPVAGNKRKQVEYVLLE